jgi:hypothetical protein
VLKTSLLTSLFLSLALVSSRAAPNRRFPTEALEKVEDPPIYIFRLESSPRMLSKFGAFTSYQVNVDVNGNNIRGDAANEPSITVNPTDHNKMAIGWRQFNTVASNFRQAGVAYSNDGGTTWVFPGILQNNVFRSDPVLNSDSTGNFFYLSLLGNFFDDIWRSLNGGQAWVNIGPAMGGDKQWFAVDKTNSTGHGFQYQSWSAAIDGNNFNGRQFTRSTNGGMSWSDPINVPKSPSFGTLDVDSAGTLYIVGKNFDTEQLWCERSTNARNALASPTFDQNTLVNLGGVITGGQINPVGLIGQLNVAVDRSGSTSNNNVYILGSVQPTGFTTGSEVMFVRSTNAGQSFSAPRRINDDPINHNKWHWFGAIAVAPNGRIDVVWYDTRNAANNTDSQLFYSYSSDAGVTWSANVAVSAPFNPFLGYPNQAKIGDYITIVSDNGGGDVAYSATFNGEQDVYYVRVAPLASQLLNISSRADVGTVDNVAIAGFIVTGTDPKAVLIRGLGPTLAQKFNVPGVLADPFLSLRDGSGNVIWNNNNWKDSQQTQIQNLGLACDGHTCVPPNDLESAILQILQPGKYTAILSGRNGTTGVGLIEVYDASPGTSAELTNVSTRGFVGTDQNVLIGGFIASGGTGSTTVVVRGLGPTLGQPPFNVPGVLADPFLSLRDSNGTVLWNNNNWKDSQQTQIQNLGLACDGHTCAPPNDLESAILRTVAPGNYTAILSGMNGTTGIGLVEIYKVR